MKLSIDGIASVGGFSHAPVEKEIQWKNREGETITMNTFVRPLSFSSAVAEVRSVAEKTDVVAGRIASSIVDEHGDPVFSVDDITGRGANGRGPLDAKLTMALLNAIAEVNQPEKH